MSLEKQVEINRKILGLIHAKHQGDPAWGTAQTLEWRYATLLMQDAQLGEAYLKSVRESNQQPAFPRSSAEIPDQPPPTREKEEHDQSHDS